MVLTVRQHDLPLVRPLATAHGPIAVRRVLTITLAGGRGEAAPLPGFGGETLEACQRLLTRVEAEPAGIWQAWTGQGPLPHEAWFVDHPCARAAVEAALLEVLALRADVPVAAFLGATAAVPVNALVATPDDARRAQDAGYRTVKAKIGGDPATAHARARALALPGLALRLDANASWTLAEVLAADLPPLEFLEQPLSGIVGHAALRPRWRIALDESIRSLEDVRAAAGEADAVVLKPMFLGGYGPTKLLADEARRLGLGVILTTALDGALGRAAATHYAIALGLTAHAQGLATGELLATDLTAQPLRPHQGVIALPDAPGWGIGSII